MGTADHSGHMVRPGGGQHGGHGSTGESRPSPQQLLADRFARGEIDEAEYRDRLAALQLVSETPGRR